MNHLIPKFIEKLKIEKYLYLQEGSFKLYRNIYKEKSNIRNSILSNKLVEVMATNKVNGDYFYLISAQGNELGWVTIDDPIFIYSTFPEKVIINNTESSNVINQKLNLFGSVEKNDIYTKRYFIEYKNLIYIGITKGDILLCFLPREQISNGDIESVNFTFNRSSIKLYEDIYRKKEVEFLNNKNYFECDKALNIHEKWIGSFKKGKTRYWFYIEDTNLDINKDIKTIKRSADYYFLEHLLYSQREEINRKPSQVKNQFIEEQIVKKRFKEYREQIEELLKENQRLKALHEERKITKHK